MTDIEKMREDIRILEIIQNNLREIPELAITTELKEKLAGLEKRNHDMAKKTLEHWRKSYRGDCHELDVCEYVRSLEDKIKRLENEA